jgi:hypothetical protein
MHDANTLDLNNPIRSKLEYTHNRYGCQPIIASVIMYAIKQGTKLMVLLIIKIAITGVKLGGCGNSRDATIQKIKNMLIGFNI